MPIVYALHMQCLDVFLLFCAFSVLFAFFVSENSIYYFCCSCWLFFFLVFFWLVSCVPSSFFATSFDFCLPVDNTSLVYTLVALLWVCLRVLLLVCCCSFFFAVFLFLSSVGNIVARALWALPCPFRVPPPTLKCSNALIPTIRGHAYTSSLVCMLVASAHVCFCTTCACW